MRRKSRPSAVSRALPPGRRDKRNQKLIGRHGQLVERLNVIRVQDLDGQREEREVLPNELKHLCIHFESDCPRLGEVALDT